LLTVLGLNLHRLWVETPDRVPTTPESVVVHAVLSPACQQGDGPVFVVAPEPEPLLRPIFTAYALGDRSPILVKSDDLARLFGTGQAPFRCIVVEGSRDAQGQAQELLRQVYAGRSVTTLTDHSGRTRVTLVR
jgi:hypothetical protein